MIGINRISDPALLKAYTDAVKLELAEEFIMILLAELKRRNLSVPHSSPK
ncbi:sporulation histidine kinase inhibitor Sda [Niallia hominis]|uniref:Sporulation histidine kinase inhibitor Sda n=1 Tax=Niallia hominis TaxID=3133173 RepID=A0ABV1EVM8_9BACI